MWIRSIVFTIAFSAAISHNYDHKQGILKHRNKQNGSKVTNHRSQTMTFSTHLSKVLFPKRSAKMIDSSEKRKLQLAFELQSTRVFEKRCRIAGIIFPASLTFCSETFPVERATQLWRSMRKPTWCKKTPAKSHPAALLCWWTRNLFSGQSEAGNSNVSVRKSAQGPVAWNARNSYGYTVLRVLVS